MARRAFLDQACLGDASLRLRVETMLAAHEAPDELPPKTAPAVEATIKLNLDPPDEAVGQTLGRYKLLERVGEGGYGVVYVAEQTVPVRRRVALKVIKLGMDTKAVVARFEAERQALAMMDHPNIAKVLDAGTTELGRPYFVMELVRGIRITEYCDQAQLTTRDRIDLFIKVCQAIQHAHQKGIIHRDLKPSNILVTLHDGVPVPKVIDFGIAKATEGRLTDNTVYTQLHQFIGTPAYMSPEQAEMSGLDIDTRSDIYSLGVMLYELLVGSTPFDAKELAAAGIDAMRKTIREKEPVRPSTKLCTLQGDELTTAAKRRSVETSKLAHQLRGDLDWIVMKCLEKDRSRRYETANGLALDLRRHLNNEPVLARPPSAAYKLQKAFRRNKLVFTAAAAVACALLLGIIVSCWQAVLVKRAQALTMQTRGEAEKLSNFMLDEFYTELEPSGQYDTVAELAKRAVAYYDSVPASLRTRETERNSAMARARLALVTARQGDAKLSLATAKDALAKLDQLRAMGDLSDGTIFASGLAFEAEYWSYFAQIDFQSAVGPLAKGAALLRPFATSPAASRRVKLEYANILNMYSHCQSYEAGIATCEEALRILWGLGALDLSDLSAASAWADIADSEAREMLALHRMDDAERMEKQTQSVAQGVLARRPGDLRARMDLFFAPQVLGLISLRRFHDAEALDLEIQSEQAIKDYIRYNPSDDHGWSSWATAENSICAILFREGRMTECFKKAQEAIQMERERKGAPNGLPALIMLRPHLACWKAQAGNRAEAEQNLAEARRIFAASLAGDHAADRQQLYKHFFEDAEYQITLAFGENQAAFGMATNALPRLDNYRNSLTDAYVRDVILDFKGNALEVAARAALILGHYADAENAARALISLEKDADYARIPDDLALGSVLLAESCLQQGRHAEALKTLEPILAHLREDQTHGAGFLSFRQHFARALYVEALAEPADNGGAARSREELKEASTLIQGLTAEATQLHDSQELLSWIAAAGKKLNEDPAPNK